MTQRHTSEVYRDLSEKKSPCRLDMAIILDPSRAPHCYEGLYLSSLNML